MIGGYEAGELNDALESIQKHVQNDRVSMSGEVVGKDDDGTVWVHVLGGVEATPVEASAVEVEPGDIVDVTIGNGTARVLSNLSQPSASVGSVRRVERAASEAGKSSALAMQVATEADRVATATGQHFWHNDRGGHVTDEEQADYLAAEAAGFPDWDPEDKPWYALLLNAFGLLLKTGARYLASFTQSAVTFFDGQGNGAENVVASFGADGAQIGKSGEIHLEQETSGISVIDDAGGELLKFGVSERDGDLLASITSNTLGTLIKGANGNVIIDGEMLFASGASGVVVTGAAMDIGVDRRMSVGADDLISFGVQSLDSMNPSFLTLQDGSITFKTNGGDVVFETNGEIPPQGNGSIRGIGAETLSGHNLSPFFAHDLTDRSYWYNGAAVTNLLNASSYTADGWAHVTIPATSSATQYNIRITRAALERAVTEGEDATLLVELANVSTTGSTGSKLYQPTNMTGELVQLSGSQDLSDGLHWFDGAATGTGGEGLCLQLWSGTVACEFDVRVSLFAGRYRGSYKPYVVPEAELLGVLGLTVESTTTAADIATAGAGFELTSAQYATYGKMAQLTLYAKSTNALTAGTGYTVATLASGKAPLVNPSAASLGTTTAVQGTAQVNSNGSVLLRPSAAVAANTSFRINASYILA